MNHAFRIGLLLLLALAQPAFGQGAASAPTKRVGYLVWSSVGPRGHLESALVDGLRDQGYVEGRNLVIDRRYVDAGIDQVRAAAEELTALMPDVIVSTCSDSTAAAKQATAASHIPVVMAYVADPVGQGLIASYSQPGGNVTGLASQAEDTMPKLLQLISEMVPAGATVAVLYHTTSPAHPRLWQRLESAAKERGTRLLRVDFAKRVDIAPAIEAIGEGRIGAMIALPDDNMMYNAREQLVKLVEQRRIPVIFGSREFTDIGGLMSYGPSLASSYRYTATYVDKLFGGACPANLPVEQPTRFELVVNLRTARGPGLAIPPSLLALADEVIR